ncbi:MAG: VRR-NUC domain-containing protein [Proteobacteria bacterium]|nr:VRR-NUC domain-containing protein [Pseudomonadota bacterium]
MSGCAEILSPGVVAASLFQSGSGIATERGPQNLVQRCPNTPKDRPDPATRKAMDDALICKLCCCCLNDPVLGEAEQHLMQNCMDKIFKSADKLLGFNSRYKSEISYDMTQSPPSPMMHRVEGEDTTEASHSWMGRAFREIVDYVRGKGMVRRPDLVIADDPCLPPTQDNIERVVEIKFKNDKRSRGQDEAYRDIAGDKEKYSIFRIGNTPKDNEQGCDCGENQPQEPVPVPVSEQEKQGAWGAVGNTLGWGVVTVAGAVATAALLASPFEGPVGEMAAGSATAAAAARTATAWRALSAAF